MSTPPSRRALLVEDDDDHAHLVGLCLKETRVFDSIERVADGEQALAYLRREGPYADNPAPDVVLLELKLPKIDGHDVLQAIKSDERLKSIPVVVLTTSDAQADRVRAYRNHANSYLVKPLDFDRFTRLIHDLAYYWAVWNRPSD